MMHHGLLLAEVAVTSLLAGTSRKATAKKGSEETSFLALRKYPMSGLLPNDAM
jgi:hypothetical protein